MRKRFAMALAFTVFMVCCCAPAFADTLTVNQDQPVHAVSPTLYGIFIEDINCAVDGGLYAELLKNRSFENEGLWNPQHADHWEAWSLKKREKAQAVLENDAPLHENNPTYLRVSMEAGGLIRVVNQGFGGNSFRGGVPIVAGESYDFSFWMRADETAVAGGRIVISLTDAAGNSLCGAPLDISLARQEEENQWIKIGTAFTAEATGGAVLSVTVSGQGTIDLDMFSLMPQSRTGADWPGGGMRTDIVDMLRELKPRFLRFPGGCVVEGTYVRENAYDWKVTVGNVETRREIPNTWGGMQTMGVGFYEYFCLCEELGALPVPVVHAGVLCQARDVKDPPLTLEETAVYAQDILDLIEFATGDADTTWGALRVQMGHAEPFDLQYIAIGNENWGTVYFNRYEILSKAVKDRYPDITCIVAAGPVAEGGLFNDSWSNIRRMFAGDLVDEHYYMNSAWFPSHISRYDKYPRATKVFLGEYAAHEPVQGTRRPNNVYAALCEAAYLTGVERNSDVVVMSCYAPLLCREGEVDWTPDLIWFNDDEVYATPSYYVQQMFSLACGTELVASETDGDLFQVATRTGNALQIKIVNLSEKTKPLTLLLSGIPDQTVHGQMLAGEKNHVNSFAKPDKAAPQEVEIVCTDSKAETKLPPWSLTVLEFSLAERK